MRLSSIMSGELLAALAVLAFGGFVLFEATGYDPGTPSRMGPGFFPLAIGAFLMLIGVFLVLEAVRMPRIRLEMSIRSIAAVASGLVAFALLLPGAGLVPATVTLVVLSLLAEEKWRWKLACGLAVALSAIGYFVFNVGFRIPLDPFWW